MASTYQGESTQRIPEGFRAVPVHRGTVEGALRICVVVRTAADPVGGWFVLLRDLAIATVYLGCLVDASGAVWEWIEIWVQKIRDPGLDLGSCGACDNPTLDELWEREIRLLHALQPEDWLDTGWERTSPYPTFIDRETWEPVHPEDAAKRVRWTLCRDDAMLQAHGLPAFSRSPHRYLVLEGVAREKARFVGITPDAPKADAVVGFEAFAGGCRDWTPFNPGAGFLASRRFYPLDLEDYLELIGGKPWAGPGHGIDRFRLGGAYQALEDPALIEGGGAQLHLGVPTSGTRLVEALYLKLQVLAEVLRLVRESVARTQRPFFNLSPESFRVRLEALGSGLPLLWSARLSWAKPGEAVALPIETGGPQRFVPLVAPNRSVYLPEMLGCLVRTTATFRIRQVALTEAGSVQVEGIVQSREAETPSPKDVARIGMVVNGQPVRIHGRLIRGEEAAREMVFEGFPEVLDAAAATSLRAAQGVPLAKVSLEIIPAFGTDCDLYSLGVLAVRALLVNPDKPLPVALDEVLSLARLVAANPDPNLDLAGRIEREFEVHPQWQTALGPHRLIAQGLEVGKATGVLPLSLWCRALAAVVPLFPESGPDSLGREVQDATGLAPESVFDQPIEAFREVMRLVRSLIVSDWALHAEVRKAVRACLAE